MYATDRAPAGGNKTSRHTRFRLIPKLGVTTTGTNDGDLVPTIASCILITMRKTTKRIDAWLLIERMRTRAINYQHELVLYAYQKGSIL